VGGTGSKPHRRLGSIAAMLAGAVTGALLQASPSATIALAALLAAGVAVAFQTVSPEENDLVR
jgi:hypothetical protein